MNLNDCDIIHAGISGGKDSQAAATWLVRESGVPIDKIRLSFNDTGNEHQYTYAHIRQIESWLGVRIEWIRAELDFYQLAQKNKRFPWAKGRFCTQYLKMRPTQQHILQWMREGKRVLLITGVRRAESEARSHLEEFGFDTYFACDVYRPLIDWTTAQIFAYIQSQGQVPNPLYALGAQRVGCLPCVMSRKSEIRMIADKFPERIDMIREAERNTGEGGAGFFSSSGIPKKFHRTTFVCHGKPVKVANIDDVVDWAHTARGGREYDSGPQGRLFGDDIPVCTINSGACE